MVIKLSLLLVVTNYEINNTWKDRLNCTNLVNIKKIEVYLKAFCLDWLNPVNDVDQ